MNYTLIIRNIWGIYVQRTTFTINFRETGRKVVYKIQIKI
jgi:hypothetical protein